MDVTKISLQDTMRDSLDRRLSEKTQGALPDPNLLPCKSLHGGGRCEEFAEDCKRQFLFEIRAVRRGDEYARLR